jgi:cyclopropane fatty-acyl-phospholipid synthase-like methyltransferase
LKGYDPARYGKTVGDDYDALYPEEGLESEATVATLAELAQARPGRSVLEFGIGTGRLDGCAAEEQTAGRHAGGRHR